MDPAVPPKGVANAHAFLANLNDVGCVICNDAFSASHVPAIMPTCRHVFGASCLRKWVLSPNRGHNRCPVCRAVLFDDRLPLAEDENMADEQQEEEARARMSRPAQRSAGVPNTADTATARSVTQSSRAGQNAAVRGTPTAGNSRAGSTAPFHGTPIQHSPGNLEGPPSRPEILTRPFDDRLIQMATAQVMRHVEQHGIPPGRDRQQYIHWLAEKVVRHLNLQLHRRRLIEHQQRQRQRYREMLLRQTHRALPAGSVGAAGSQWVGPASQTGTFVAHDLPSLPQIHILNSHALNGYANVAQNGINGVPSYSLQGGWMYSPPGNRATPDAGNGQLSNGQGSNAPPSGMYGSAM